MNFVHVAAEKKEKNVVENSCTNVCGYQILSVNLCIKKKKHHMEIFTINYKEIINMTPADIIILPEGGGKFVIPRSGFEVGLDDEFYKPSPAKSDVPLVCIKNDTKENMLKIFRSVDTPKTTPFPEYLWNKVLIVNKEIYFLGAANRINAHSFYFPMTEVYDEENRIIGYRSLGYIY